MYYNSNNLNKAKSMRSNPTYEEHIIWEMVRAKRFLGLKFKRQVLIGNYIADFLCVDKNVVIELDGGQHNEDSNIIYDNKRTEYFEGNGYQVIRLWNNDIRNNLEGVYEYLSELLSD